MSTLPRILVIDDVYGRMRNGRNRDREDFCVRLGLQDVTGDGTPEKVDRPVAEVVFLQGQVEGDGQVQNDLEGTLEQVRCGWAAWPRWALLLLDLHFKTGPVGPGGEPAGSEQDRDPARYFGLTILDHLWKDPSLRDIPVIIMSAMEREAVERRFTDRGVFDFADKSTLDRDKLWQLLSNYGLLQDEKGTIIGHSLSLLKALRDARRRASQKEDNILVLGETGTGKELSGQYIHRWSGRKGSYQTLFPQGVPETLIEDELFGHVKGAFTGATADKAGAAESAHGGTLFIDEFGELPLTIQGKLLRLLDKDTREVQRLGSRELKKLSLQVVMATNRLDIQSESGFRQDLLSRAGISNPILLPPLRERKEDIPLLVRHFVKRAEKSVEGAASRTVTDEAMEVLTAYSWPHNVRELRREVERIVTVYPGLRFLSETHLKLGVQRAEKEAASPLAVRSPGAPSSGDGVSGAAKPASEAGSLSPAEPSGSTASPAVVFSADVDTFVEHIIEYTERLDFETVRVHDLAGKLTELQAAHALLIACYLIAALERTRTPLERETQHTPALKLLTGEDLDSSQAYALFLRVIHGMPREIALSALAHPVLSEVYEKAVNNRKSKDIREE